jgi:hypothetical protein
MYECMLQRVLAGTMPKNKGCTGDPAQDAGNSSCLSEEQIQLLTDWVTAGGGE